jgi:enamine deaminase RidA (YjgF/YER057c/UK114 family)
MNQRIGARLLELGMSLPSPPPAVGSYRPSARQGDLVYTSGQLPFVDGTLLIRGKVGVEVPVEEAVEAARICAVNALAAASVVTDLDAVTHVLKMTAYIACPPGFIEQATVANGASDLLVEVFGELGSHARAAVGVAALPLDAPVELEMILGLG